MPGYKSSFPVGFSLDSWNGKNSVTPVWLWCCWSSPGTAFSESSRVTTALAGMTSLPQTYRNLRNIPSACCNLCPGCARPAFTQLRLHIDFLLLSQNHLSTGLCQSQTQVLMFLQLNPALNLSPVLMSQCLFDLCCCLVFSCYWEKWFPVMAAQQEEMNN